MPPKSWKSTILGDYAEVIMGQSPESEYYSTDCTQTPFLQGNRTFGLKYPTFDTYTSKRTKIAPKGSVIVSVRAPVGDTNMAPSELCLGRGVAALVSKDKDNEFLYYLVKSLKPLLNQNENGSVFGSINRDDLNNFPILLPNLDERCKIGTILSLFDTKIELNRKINDNLMVLSELIFQNWIRTFCDGDYVSAIPNTNMQSLDHLCSKITDGSHFSPESEENGTHAMFSVKDMRTNGFDRSECKMIGDLAFEKLKSAGCVPIRDDIVIAKDGSYLKELFLINEDHEDAILSSIAIFRPDRKTIYPEILLAYLRLPEVLATVRDNFVSGSAVPRIILKNFKELQLCVPSLTKQDEILPCLRTIREMIFHKDLETIRLTQLRDYLLPKLICGDIDCSYPSLLD